MADIFTEVWKQVRADRARALWVRLAPYVIGLALVIIGGVGAYEFYKAQRDARFERAGHVFESGLRALGDPDDDEDDDIVAAKEYFSRALDSNYAALSSMYLADLELRQTDDKQVSLARERAVNALRQGAKGKGVWARMARLKLGYLLAGTASLAEVEAVLAPLIAGDDEYSPLAREIIAAMASDKGDTDRARAEYELVEQDDNAEQSLLRRARLAKGFIDAAPLIREEDATETQTEAASGDEAGGNGKIAALPSTAPTESAPLLVAPSLAPGLGR